MRAFVRENGLSLFFLVLFAGSLLLQSLAGQHTENAARVSHQEDAISWLEYVTSPGFGAAVMENWQSEFLQFALFIGVTVWLVQKGSAESSALEDIGLESDEEQKVGRFALANSPAVARGDGIRRRLYENSLLLAMTSVFLATWFAQSLNNWRVFNQEQALHGDAATSWGSYIRNPEFWEKTLQNWQSEFLAVGTMAVFTIYLRQRGSPESKPVGAPHDQTGTSG